MKRSIANALKATALTCVLIPVCATTGAQANGFFESRSWQFQTSADRANNAAVLDMIERKKGGYYDGFSTTVNTYNNTNIGSQINCNNLAEATGNAAQNAQSANSPNVNNESSTEASSGGNVADNTTDGKGGNGGIGNDQSNTGDVSSGIDNSHTSSSSGPINGGPSNQDLHNHQDNSGNQYASVDGTACDMTGSTVRGNVRSSITGALN